MLKKNPYSNIYMNENVLIQIWPDSYYFAFIYRNGRRTKTRKPYKAGNHGRPP